ncbi:hemerythrin domain-containing protein [Actinoplanes sp. NPDC051411]|uniref:hemerythrin domain-containing protein n=1 Tax=Actinoplanes sp. NPDC051411 TaxID=3155522 RepID=UPI00343659BB
MGTTNTRMADSRDMIGAHVCFRREFRDLPLVVRRVTAGDKADAATIAAHAEFLVDLMHHHHRGEDTGVWPLLHRRCPDETQKLVTTMEEQHAHLDRALEDIKSSARQWGLTATTADREAVARHAEALLVPLAEHLDLEESKVLPLIDTYLTEGEWKAVVGGEAATIPKKQLPLVFGMMLYDADDVTQRMMRTNVPALLWPVFSHLARRSYAKYAQAVHGTAAPRHFRAG